MSDQDKHWRIYGVPGMGEVAVWTDGDSVENVTRIMTGPQGQIGLAKLDKTEVWLNLSKCAMSFIPSPELVKSLSQIWDENFVPPKNGPIIRPSLGDIEKFRKKQ